MGSQLAERAAQAGAAAAAVGTVGALGYAGAQALGERFTAPTSTTAQANADKRK